MGKQNIFDWDGLCFLEDVFTHCNEIENQWEFHYYIIIDNFNVPVAATFFMKNPLYMTSKVLGMGSLFTEGNHCYINKKHSLSKQALLLLLDKAEILCQELNADMLVLRDFEQSQWLSDLFHNLGFIKMRLTGLTVRNLLQFYLHALKNTF